MTVSIHSIWLMASDWLKIEIFDNLLFKNHWIAVNSYGPE
jgi:hypothetical protein